jgi:hypothetical protein
MDSWIYSDKLVIDLFGKQPGLLINKKEKSKEVQ